MRDYKLSIEYKHLKSHCPGGVYLVPSFGETRLFHGVIFCRRGAFANGIFKFSLKCPPRYNGINIHPVVKFTSYIYNPHVHPETGEVDLEVAYPRWDPHKCFLVTALTYVKRIFYIKDYDELTATQRAMLPNQDALKLFLENPDGYRRRVLECVKESQRSQYLNTPDSTVRFTEEGPHLDTLLSLLKEKFGVTCEGESDLDTAPVGITKEGVLECIEKVKKMHCNGNPGQDEK